MICNSGPGLAPWTLYIYDQTLVESDHHHYHAIHVEVGSNTSIVALRVVQGDEKKPVTLGHNWVTLSLGDKKTWSSRLGVGHKADNLAL
jgi:hypothetical protein